MVLDEFFDAVLLISLPGKHARAERAITQLREYGLSTNVQVVPAVDGNKMRPSAWWRSGPGAWGCLMSHVQCMYRMHMEGWQQMLVLEDDVIWQPDAAVRFTEFIPELPEDWGQLYLGGQHRAEPRRLATLARVYGCRSVNRTHAYAIHAGHLAAIQAHVLHAPDYISAPFAAHIDHQLEKAHQREDWPVYAPSWWLAGQGENKSDINGRQHPDKWWQWLPDAEGKLPVLLFDRDPTDEERKHIHFGWASDPATGRDPAIIATTEDMPKAVHAIRVIASEAVQSQRIAAVRVEDAAHAQRLTVMLGSRALPVAAAGDLAHLTNYPANGLLPHRWLNPEPQL